MSRVVWRARWSLVAMLGFVLLTTCCWGSTRLLDFTPIHDASHEARRHAAARGLKMEGFTGDFVTQPDAWGGCEVRIEFTDRSGRALAGLRPGVRGVRPLDERWRARPAIHRDARPARQGGGRLTTWGPNSMNAGA